ncbi:hypothetical protein [Dyella tabacisoli]|uniref:Uncharacterized protein n=1 Tax=Dyella tabacisoli TaxID=2282381 RepID=A0A369UN32_9GAMM|nr:hypothetical protein [Dyella tabacisoli]RDD79729.1 hypothetical protein DVJ77_20860 [Dyella tabacisoli]
MKIDYAAQCRFFSAEDAIRYALAAYYAATQNIEPPKGEDWLIDGQPYACASDFADAFVQEVADRVSAAAYAQRLPRLASDITGTWWPNDGEELTSAGEVFLRRIMNHLPPVDNRVHNRPSNGAENA